MKTVVLSGFGRPARLEFLEVPRPHPRKNELLIRIHATTVTSGDVVIWNLPFPIRIGMRLALGLVVFVYGLWAFTGPADVTNAISIGISLVFAVITVSAFAWPLWVAHRRLVKEKEARLADVASRFEAATHELHRRLDSGRLAHMDDLNKAVATLEIEQNALLKIPTWPWKPGVVRAVIAALLVS